MFTRRRNAEESRRASAIPTKASSTSSLDLSRSTATAAYPVNITPRYLDTMLRPLLIIARRRTTKMIKIDLGIRHTIHTGRMSRTDQTTSTDQMSHTDLTTSTDQTNRIGQTTSTDQTNRIGQTISTNHISRTDQMIRTDRTTRTTHLVLQTAALATGAISKSMRLGSQTRRSQKRKMRRRPLSSCKTKPSCKGNAFS